MSLSHIRLIPTWVSLCSLSTNTQHKYHPAPCKSPGSLWSIYLWQVQALDYPLTGFHSASQLYPWRTKDPCRAEWGRGALA